MIVTIMGLSSPMKSLAKDETIMGIQFVDGAQVSFSVPLHVMTVGISDDDEIQVPTNYEIANMGMTLTHASIGVVGVAIEGMAEDTSPFTAITPGLPTQSNQMQLIIGGINIAGTNTFDIRKSTGLKMDLSLVGSIFEEAGGPKEIPTGNTGNRLTIPMSGKIRKETRPDATAQRIFKMHYTISPISGTGAPIGAPYVGDNNPFITP